MKQLENKVVKSRKEHVCGLCLGIIKIKTDYNRQTNVYEGKIYNFKDHIHCSFLADYYNMYRGCFDEGLTSNDFETYIDEIFPGDLALEEKAKLLYDKLNI